MTYLNQILSVALIFAISGCSESEFSSETVKPRKKHAGSSNAAAVVTDKPTRVSGFGDIDENGFGEGDSEGKGGVNIGAVGTIGPNGKLITEDGSGAEDTDKLDVEDGTADPAACLADDALAETQTFPLNANCGSNNCAHAMYYQFAARIKACLGHDLPKVGGQDTLVRTSHAKWRSGSSSRYRNMSDSHGTFETEGLKLICRIYGYENYVSSTARDRADGRRNDRLNWTSPRDNSSYRFKDGITFDFLDTGDPASHSEFWTRHNRNTSHGVSAYNQTWLNTITCKDKVK